MSNEAAPAEWVVVTDRDCQPAHDSPRVDLSRCETWHVDARHRPSGGPPAWVFSLRRTPGGRWFELQESFSGWTLTVRRAHWIADAELTPFWDSHPEITPPDDVVAANTAHDATELPPPEGGSKSPAPKARSTSTDPLKRIESEAPPPPPAPEAPAVEAPKAHEGERRPKPTAENRAMALATQWATDGKPLSVSALAKEVGCSREHL